MLMESRGQFSEHFWSLSKKQPRYILPNNCKKLPEKNLKWLHTARVLILKDVIHNLDAKANAISFAAQVSLF